MKSTIVILAFCVVPFSAILITSQQGLCCTCGQVDPPSAFYNSEFVVSGFVIAKDVPKARQKVVKGDTMMVVSTADMVCYTIQVISVFKGELADEIFVYSARDESSCGFLFRVGELYLIYGSIIEAGQLEGFLQEIAWAGTPEPPLRRTGLCSGTKSYYSAVKDLEFLETVNSKLQLK